MKTGMMDRGIYLLTGVLCSVVMLAWKLLNSRSFEFETWWGALVTWLVVAGIPLCFVFFYPRFVFESPSPNRPIHAAVTSSVCFAAAAVLFPLLVSAAQTKLFQESDSLLVSIGSFVGFFSSLVIFLVSAGFVIFKRRSSLAALAVFLIWPYWSLLAIIEAERYFQAGFGDAVLYFLCFAAPLFMVFAAGAIPHRVKLPHTIALMGCLAAVWLFRTVVPNQLIGNVWVVFNQRDGSPWLSHADQIYAATAILSIAALILALMTATIRLLPPGWMARNTAVRERTWPAFVVCVVVMSAWFEHSVLPYRIPGGVDPDRVPALKILHLQKHGLRVHEKCISVAAYKDQVQSVYFTEDDRKLLHYTFEQRSASSVLLPQGLVQQIRALPISNATDLAVSKPVHSWTADNWYVYAEGRYTVYGAANANSVPTEVNKLFQDLDGLPKRTYDNSEISDVCLGFCYDPLSAMGLLYANDRCHSDLHGTISCR